MAGPYKTRCPHCGAQFKISDEHLGQARGAVRCGSCLRIFQATDHLVGDAAPPAADRWRHALDDAPAENDDDGLKLSDDFLDLDGDEPDDPDPFADLDEPSNGGDSADESWAEALLEELEDDRAPAAAAG
ncbi:MAG TPA: DUF3426 domain-containing protein, partial [Alcanivorax sp.]|nr:DUF3426 domain-containing protein [Alcanivorax sp.]